MSNNNQFKGKQVQAATTTAAKEVTVDTTATVAAAAEANKAADTAATATAVETTVDTAKAAETQVQDSATKTSATEAEEVLKSAAPQAVEVAAAATTQPLVPVIPQPQFAQKAAAPAPAQKRAIPSMPVVTASKAARHGAVNPLSDTPLAEVVAKSGSADIAHLHEKLLGLDRKLSTSVSTSIEEAGKLMSDLYRALVNVVERPSSEMEFAALWTFTMRVITETPLGGFTPQRLWRGKPQWPLSHEEFLHFESIWNLIDASVRHRGDYGRFVNEKKVMIGFSGAAQGRLGFFYRSFGG